MSKEEDKPKGLNILCIGRLSPLSTEGANIEKRQDSGGVRGLSSLIILQEVMRRTRNANDGVVIHPYEHFDVIAGTGTGGVSACMLGRLRMPIKKAIEEYAKFAREVFKEKKMSGPTMYKRKKLEEVLKTMIREATGDEKEMMDEGRGNTGCKTAVFAMARHNLNAGLPVMFRSYNADINPGPDCTIWEALYATMAHPDLFKSIEIIDSSIPQSFVGGEIGCCNPLTHVLNEVKRLHPERHIACIISIGAGHARTIQVPSPSRWYRIQDVVVMKDMATDSERVAEEMTLRFQDTSNVYFRFNIDQGMQNMKDGSWEKMGEAVQHAMVYMQKSETSQKLEGAVRAGMQRRGTVSTAHAGDAWVIAGQVTVTLDETKRLFGFKRCPAPTKFYTGREDENTQVINCITGGENELRHTWDEWDHIIYVDASSPEAIERALKEFGAARSISQAHKDVIEWLESCEVWEVVCSSPLGSRI
ncbi:unnamed protein product [Rhizoctonia solani]|uniref:PNPLA domain-containing protein n=1 Tax=Rhizoctonia solani TaxID=456999 RepID=A0A8H3DYU5_9AGAM|nr:unnamed protein product [Rhizoctonia solani]